LLKDGFLDGEFQTQENSGFCHGWSIGQQCRKIERPEQPTGFNEVTIRLVGKGHRGILKGKIRCGHQPQK
jgi:hypothetical protein